MSAERVTGLGLNGVGVERGWRHLSNGRRRLRGWRMKRFGLGMGEIEKMEEVKVVVALTVMAMVGHRGVWDLERKLKGLK